MFIHDALDELITCGETDIPIASLKQKIAMLSKQIVGKGCTGFESQYQVCGNETIKLYYVMLFLV